MRVLLVNPDHSLPDKTAEMLRDRGWSVATTADFNTASRSISSGHVDAVLVGRQVTGPTGSAPGANLRGQAFENLLRMINAQRVPAVLVSDEGGEIAPTSDTLIDVASGSASETELLSRLSTVTRYDVLVRRMEAELETMQRLGKRLNRHFSEVDQEMRLAGRLQRDFLPCLGEPIPGVNFATIFRPAVWVSGDIYDIFRVDENHVAFFVADAVGHGMAASLLTMFIKQAVIPKRIEHRDYRVLDPSDVMGHLNEALVDQTLPNCQFVTACYALLDTRTLKLRYARGGHPYPLLIGAEGKLVELKSSGGLLGLFSGEEYPVADVQLHAGDKVLVYTDGIELAFPLEDNQSYDSRAYLAEIERLGHLPLAEMIAQMEARLDEQSGSLDPRDDVTVVGMEIATSIS